VVRGKGERQRFTRAWERSRRKENRKVMKQNRGGAKEGTPKKK